MTSGDLNLNLTQNDPSTFSRACKDLSSAFFRLSMRCVVFELAGGGAHMCPPGRAKVAQTPGRARVN